MYILYIHKHAWLDYSSLAERLHVPTRLRQGWSLQNCQAPMQLGKREGAAARYLQSELTIFVCLLMMLVFAYMDYVHGHILCVIVLCFVLYAIFIYHAVLGGFGGRAFVPKACMI